MRTAFIHTNGKQMIGAVVAAHAMKRNSRKAGTFDVKILSQDNYPWYHEYDGRTYLREGREHLWDMEDLQTFTTLRFMPPGVMNYTGRALVVDPDVFAVGDVADLFDCDMQGKSIFAKWRGRYKGYADYYASSVMLLDNSKLKHWNVRQWFDDMFQKKRDYEVWLRLGYEDPASIGRLASEWNDFDRFAPDTRMLHNTKRMTQPWKKGLPIDFTKRKSFFRFLPANYTPARLIQRVRLAGTYKAHPDVRQEQYFFALLRECVENGTITEELINRHIASDHVRRDAFDLLQRVPSVESIMNTLQSKVA